MKIKFGLLCLALVLFLCAGSQIMPKGEEIPGLSAITQAGLLETVKELSSPKYKGRLPGSAEYNLVAKYMADEFEKLHLLAIGDEDYFQKFTTEYNEITGPCKLSLVTEEKEIKEYKHGVDYAFRGFTGSGNIKASVAFVGYGLSEPEAGYDDYKDVDVKGKVVIMFKQLPSWKLAGKEWNSSLRYRSNIAAKHGAVATMFVSKPMDKEPQKPIGSVMDGQGEQITDHPTLQIDVAVADAFLGDCPKSLKRLQLEIDSLKKPQSLSLKTTAAIQVTAKYAKKETMNVAGMIQGVDPVLKNEFVILSAHLDHVGSQGDVIYPGANDDASGSAAVLQMARAFVASGVKPKRSVVFLLFACEETGLDGAKYAANTDHLVDYGKTVAMLNLDCIAYGDSIQVGNGLSAPLLWKIARENDSSYTKQMVKRTWNGGGADATPFHQIGIPCLYFVTTNSYKHLHLPTDTPETLNMPLFEKVVKLAYITAYQVATQGKYVRETVKP